MNPVNFTMLSIEFCQSELKFLEGIALILTIMNYWSGKSIQVIDTFSIHNNPVSLESSLFPVNQVTTKKWGSFSQLQVIVIFVTLKFIH